jgi:uncharacterized protein YhfF
MSINHEITIDHTLCELVIKGKNRATIGTPTQCVIPAHFMKQAGNISINDEISNNHTLCILVVMCEKSANQTM